jgi:hypothetical protein
VVEAHVVLRQEVGTIVTAVRRPNDGVDMMPRRLGIVETDTRTMLELDQHDRAVQPLVLRGGRHGPIGRVRRTAR